MTMQFIQHYVCTKVQNNYPCVQYSDYNYNLNFIIISTNFLSTFHSVFLLTVQETLEAIQRLSACLNIQPSAFSYAGIKDKKAITTQYMVVRDVTPEQ